MPITLVPCNTRCLNMGDVAMLQIATARLHVLWPREDIRVFTSDAAALARYCPDVTPVHLPDRPGWCTDRYLAGRLHAWLPEGLSDRLANLNVAVACRAPRVRERLVALRTRLRPQDRRDLTDFLTTIAGSRLVFISGAGGLADHFRDYSNLILFALQCARARGIPTAMASHGFGPLTAPDLVAKATAVLPGVDVIALREERKSGPLVSSLGVRPERVIATGDDAIELAYQARVDRMGKAVGVNLRIARSSAVTERDIHVVREGLHRFAAIHAAPWLPLPIARQDNMDVEVIRQLIDLGDTDRDGRELDTPLKVIQQIGRCRFVVTGAYHAAVFALAQGIPAVCLARSRYFADKFGGLVDQFGDGCQIVSLDAADVPALLEQAMVRAWEAAPVVRQELLGVATRQIARGHAAYEQMQRLVELRAEAHAARGSVAEVRL